MMLKTEHCWGCGSRGGIGLQGQGGARPWEWDQGLGGPVGTVVEVVAGTAGWGVLLELLAKGAVVKKSGRSRRIWRRQRWGSQ